MSEIRETAIAAPEDLDWAIERVTKMCAMAYDNSRVHGLKLLKGFGYPDEAFSFAQDARALATLLQQLAAERTARAALEKRLAAASIGQDLSAETAIYGVLDTLGVDWDHIDAQALAEWVKERERATREAAEAKLSRLSDLVKELSEMADESRRIGQSESEIAYDTAADLVEAALKESA